MSSSRPGHQQCVDQLASGSSIIVFAPAVGKETATLIEIPRRVIVGCDIQQETISTILAQQLHAALKQQACQALPLSVW